MFFYRLYIGFVIIAYMLSQYNAFAVETAARGTEGAYSDIFHGIPEKYAKVAEYKYVREDYPWVVYIKDYHCQYGVQRNIDNTIHHILKQISESQQVPICIEGASGVVDTSILSSIPDEEIRDMVCDYFMKNGKISGAEFYSVTRSYDQPLIGIDDEVLYNASYELYTEVFAAYNRFAGQIRYIDALCEAVLDKKVSAQGRDIIEQVVGMYEDFSFEAFVCGTEKYWSKMSAGSVPELVAVYRNALRDQHSLSSEKVAELQNELYGELTQVLHGEDKSRLMKSFVKFRLGETDQYVFLGLLVDQARNSGCLTQKYEILEHAHRLFETFSNIDEKELFAQCRQLADRICHEFLTPQEQEYAGVIDMWAMVKKILSLELTRERFGEFDGGQVETLFSHIDAYRRDPLLNVAAISSFDFFSHLPHLIDQASTFYVNSLSRDRALYENTMKTLENMNGRLAVIVAGGFHATGLAEILDEQNVNYVILSPSFMPDVHSNFYNAVMMNEPVTLDNFFPVFEMEVANRLSPRLRLANTLANPVLTRQLIKESVLLAKILCIAKSPELFDQLRDLGQDLPVSFRNQASIAVQSFGQKWLELYKKVKGLRGEEISYKELENLTYLLKKMVMLQVAEMKKDRTSLGIQIVEQTGDRTKIQVSFSEYKRMSESLAGDISDGSSIPIAQTERIGSFELVFHKMDDADLYGASIAQVVEVDPASAVFWHKQEDIHDVVDSIGELKKTSSASPFDSRLKIQIVKKLQRLAKFMRFAAHQEQMKQNTALSFLLNANAALYAGNFDQANHFFNLYLKELPSEEKNMAMHYFKNGTVIRGQKIALPITDESGRPYVDRYGREIMSAIFDDTLIYGSEPSKVLQNRLIELANRLDGENKKYLATVVRAAAFRLTDENRNYHHDDIDVARFRSSGKEAYRYTILGQGSSVSYGAVSDLITDQYVLEHAIPGITYVYDPVVTSKLEAEGKLRYPSDDSGLVSVILPPESIRAILVNRFHRDKALEVLREYPGRTSPLLDTQGNLLWKNAPIEEMIEKYEQAFLEFEANEKTKQQAVYMKRVKNPSKIVAMSDLHSDVHAFRQTLKAAGIIDEQDAFIGKHGTVLVVNGDSIDRGTGRQQREMLDLLMKLQKDAPEKQSQVIVMLGNHETKFLSGNWYSGSEEPMRDFLYEIGFKPAQIQELRDALRDNDLFKIGMMRKENPEGMKYLDYLWNLPIIAHVGGHVFVHGGPTEAFNNLLDETLRKFPDWSMEQCIDYIFQQEISRHGFNSAMFDLNDDSVLTGAPEMTVPKFVNDQQIVDKFLSFFDGAGLLAVGHNKALGILGRNADYTKIRRVGKARNIVKLDVGTNMMVNAAQRTNQGRAYIVDPKEIDFVTTVSESGERESLMRKEDKRVHFIRTEAALLYDTMLADKSQKFLEDVSTPVAEKPKPVSDEMIMFFRMFFTIYAEDPVVLNRAFIEQTGYLLSPRPHFLKNRFEAMQRYTEIAEMMKLYHGYVEELKLGVIPRDDISIKQFQDYIETQKRINDSITVVSTKVIGTMIIDMENDVKRFYSVMAHSDIQAADRHMVNRLKSRLQQKINEYTEKVDLIKRVDDPVLNNLKRAHFYLSEADKQVSFKILDPYNGDPCIFIEDDSSVTGFVLNRTIYLSAHIVRTLWDRFEASNDEDALDRLLALFVHEIHEFRDEKDIPQDRRRLFHSEAEMLERVICGTGETGSKLDDDIEAAVRQYKEQTKDIRLVTIKKFLNGFRVYLKKQSDLNLYHAIFTRTRLPLEGDILDSLTLADNMFGMLIETRALETFHALLDDIADRTSLFFAVDHALFSEDELLQLVDLITSAPRTRVARREDSSAFVPAVTVGQTEKVAPVDIRKNLNAVMAVDKSL